MSRVTCHMSRVTCHMSRVMCHVSHVTCHMSHVTCHMSHVTCHMTCVTCHIFFFTKRWSLSVEGLLSTGPTPSSFFRTGKFEFSGSSFSNNVVVEVWASGNSSGGFKITISVDSQGQCWPLRWVAKIYQAVKDTSLHQDLYSTKERLQLSQRQSRPIQQQGAYQIHKLPSLLIQFLCKVCTTSFRM